MSRSGYNIKGCLSGEITRVGRGLSGEVRRIGGGLTGEVRKVGGELTGYISLVCSVSKDAYLNVSTDVLWLTPDMLGEEFDIYSNVNWKIDVKPSEDDKDIISMLLNELMIGNNTLFVNGDMPSQVLEMLHNGQMITNETLLVDTSVIVIKELESSTRILNKYYLKN